jgi:hypothetical protein
MEVRDGFIVGIYNYCDRWCERCALTSYCRLFADQAQYESSSDPNFTLMIEAPAVAEELPDDEGGGALPYVPPEHQPIERRAIAYSTRTSRWLDAPDGRIDRSSPRQVIAWFHILIPAKVNRALTVWPDADQELTGSDSDGSAKVALLGIERSHAAWLELVERGDAPMSEVAAFIADLVWLGEALERVRPGAREFIRPGLDEPAAVAQYLAGESGG